MACAEFDDCLPFSGASSIPLYHVLFPATLLHRLFFHPLSPCLAIYFLASFSSLLFPNSYIILFLEFYFLPFSVHVQTNVIYLTLLPLYHSTIQKVNCNGTVFHFQQNRYHIFNFKLCLSVGDVKVKSCLLKRKCQWIMPTTVYVECIVISLVMCAMWLHFCSAFRNILLNTLVWHTVPWCGSMWDAWI